MGIFNGFNGAVATFHAAGEAYSFTRGVIRVEDESLILESLGRYTGANYHGKLTSQPNFSALDGQLVFQQSELTEVGIPDSIKARKGFEIVGIGKLFIY